MLRAGLRHVGIGLAAAAVDGPDRGDAQETDFLMARAAAEKRRRLPQPSQRPPLARHSLSPDGAGISRSFEPPSVDSLTLTLLRALDHQTGKVWFRLHAANVAGHQRLVNVLTGCLSWFTLSDLGSMHSGSVDELLTWRNIVTNAAVPT